MHTKLTALDGVSAPTVEKAPQSQSVWVSLLVSCRVSFDVTVQSVQWFTPSGDGTSRISALVGQHLAARRLAGEHLCLVSLPLAHTILLSPAADIVLRRAASGRPECAEALQPLFVPPPTARHRALLAAQPAVPSDRHLTSPHRVMRQGVIAE